MTRYRIRTGSIVWWIIQAWKLSGAIAILYTMTWLMSAL